MNPPTDVPRRPRLKTRDGRCYELSGELALYHHDWTLVQGEVNMRDGSRMGHAWVERDGWAYDSVLDKCMPTPEFRARFAAVEHGRWQASGLAAAMIAHGHWGPWPA